MNTGNERTKELYRFTAKANNDYILPYDHKTKVLGFTREDTYECVCRVVVNPETSKVNIVHMFIKKPVRSTSDIHVLMNEDFNIYDIFKVEVEGYVSIHHNPNDRPS